MQPGVTLIGPVSHDIIRHPDLPERSQTGGAAFYAGMALRALGVPVHIITRVAAQDAAALLTPLQKAGARLTVLPSRDTTRFINSYGPGADERAQQVYACADPFTIEDVQQLATQWVYMAPLLQGDIETALLRNIAAQGAHRLALDAQGLLRRVVDTNVIPADWPDKYEILPFIDILKADAEEAELITRQCNPEMAARLLCGRGVDHALVTLGRHGAILCHRGGLIRQGAFRPSGQAWPVLDTTGSGDTFLAAYLAGIIAGYPATEAGQFAATAAALKQTVFGPLRADIPQISRLTDLQYRSGP